MQIDLSERQWGLVKTAVDAMADGLPNGDQVPVEDRRFAEQDKNAYVELQARLTELGL